MARVHISEEEQTDLLQEMLETDGWRHVAKPAMLREMRNIEKTLATDKRCRTDLQKVAELQIRYDLYKRILADPKQFWVITQAQREQD